MMAKEKRFIVHISFNQGEQTFMATAKDEQEIRDAIERDYAEFPEGTMIESIKEKRGGPNDTY